MSLNGKHALITGSSRGIGRGIALKLAASGAKVAIHYYQNEAAANDTLGQVRKRGSDGLVIQADVRRPEQIIAMFGKVESKFAKHDIFVSNARTDLPTFYQKPLEITPEQWDMAMDSQAKAFLIGAREAARLMSDEGRVIAITYSPGGRTGSWQPWVAMGSAKAALDSLVRSCAWRRPASLQVRSSTWTAGRPSWTPSSHLKSSKANCRAFFVGGVLVPHYVPPSRTAATRESIFTPNETEISHRSGSAAAQQ